MDERPLPELRELSAVAVRSWRRAVMLALIGALVGAGLFFQVPLRYYATSQVALAPQLSYVSLSQDQERQPPVSLDTTAALLGSRVALDEIATAMGVSRADARRSMTIAAKPLTRVLVVQVSADTRQAAVLGANAATEVLLALQADTFSLRQASVRFLKNRVALVRKEAQERIAEGNPSGELFDLVETLETRLDRAIATNNARSVVIERAVVTSDRPGQLQVFIASGLVLGLSLGFAWGWLNRRRHHHGEPGAARPGNVVPSGGVARHRYAPNPVGAEQGRTGSHGH